MLTRRSTVISDTFAFGPGGQGNAMCGLIILSVLADLTPVDEAAQTIGVYFSLLEITFEEDSPRAQQFWRCVTVASVPTFANGPAESHEPRTLLHAAIEYGADLNIRTVGSVRFGGRNALYESMRYGAWAAVVDSLLRVDGPDLQIWIPLDVTTSGWAKSLLQRQEGKCNRRCDALPERTR